MFRSILIDDFMTKNLATATREMDLLALVDLLLRRGISGTPVVDESGHLIGMVSEHDCLKAILVGTYQGDVGGIVGDVMTNQMVSSGRRRLPLVDQENHLVGQISRTDLLRAVRAYEIPEEEPAH